MVRFAIKIAINLAPSLIKKFALFSPTGRNLQLCFVNENTSEMDDANNENGVHSLPVISQSQYLQQNLVIVSVPHS